MDTETIRQITETNLATLEDRLQALMSLCEQLAAENQSLRSQQAELEAERDELMQQNEQARVRIDAMVARLKGLEQST